MDNNYELDYSAFIRSIKRNTDTPHSFLLGAGASISSGIQSAGDCIWEWKKDIFLSMNPNASDFYHDIKNVSVRNGIQTWIESEGIIPQLPYQNEYSYYVEKAYPIPDDRRKYFQNLISGKEPYIGYQLLCLLCQHEIVKAVWTTNFDGLFEKSAHKANLTPIAITLDSKDRIYRNQSKNEVLSIALHGDYKYSTLKNTSKELDAQESEFIEALARYHVDKNLIVIGFSGRDKSLMDALQKAFSQAGSGRLYWCGYGHEINNNIESLITSARNTGREAYYIPTEGFDKTLLHLSKACIENNGDSRILLDEILSSSNSNDYVNSKFTIPTDKVDKYVKSNLHPILFPKEVFQFKLNFGEERPWAFIKSHIKDKETSAVPFKNSVYAISTISELRKIFHENIEDEILRTPISVHDIKKVSAFRALMLSTVVKFLSKPNNFASNNKNKIWILNSSKSENINGQVIKIHRAVKLSLVIGNKTQYGYLSLIPTIHLTSDGEITKAHKQELSKLSLEKLFNHKYDAYLEWWRNLFFKVAKMKFEFPEHSGSGFSFAISKSTSFGEILVLDNNYRSFKPNSFDKRLAQHKGIQYLEPQLIFRNNNNLNDKKDFHPMRALTNSKPWDYHLNGKIYTNEVKLSVICSNKYSDQFSNFLAEINLFQKASHNPDYLLDFPGFSKTFNLPLNIPQANSELWYDIVVEDEGNIKSTSLKLARSITAKIEQLSNIQGGSIIVIFIPAEWHLYRKYDIEGEKFDLHDYIKAFSASRGIATQLIEEKTINNGLKCQTCWWLGLSFYVKSFRTPWILNNPESETAYAGIGYSISGSKEDTEIVIGCSHIYNSNGEGLKYKLSRVDDYVIDSQSNPYLSYDDAFQFGISIRELFYSSMNSQPKRVVVHKRTRFTKDEVKGITDSLKQANIQEIDLVEINYESDARFLATKVFQGKMSVDGFPVSRGTCIIIDSTSALLWTHGIVPSVRNPRYKYYLGGRSIPSPLKVTKHYGNSNIGTIASEILGLTKMNWNSFDLYTKLPATINSSNQIAKIGKLLSRFEGKTYDYRLFI